MESLPENKPLVWSLAVSLMAIMGLLLGSSPDFNSQFGLVDIPVEVSGSEQWPWRSLAPLSHRPSSTCFLLDSSSWSSARSWPWTSAWHSWLTVSYSSFWGLRS